MENTLEISNSMNQNQLNPFIIKSRDSEVDTGYKFDDEPIILKETELFKFSIEDSQTFSKNLFGHRDVILNEKWDNSQTVQGKIIHITPTEIFIDCLVDIENRVFEHRSFPVGLFTHITNIKVDKPILIKTRQRPGTIRIDVFPGEGIVKMDNFDINDLWDDLIGSGLDKKLNEW